MFSELGQQTMLAAGQKRGADESDGGMMQEMPMSAEQQQQQQVAMMQQQQQSNGQHPGIKRRMTDAMQEAQSGAMPGMDSSMDPAASFHAFDPSAHEQLQQQQQMQANFFAEQQRPKHPMHRLSVSSFASASSNNNPFQTGQSSSMNSPAASTFSAYTNGSTGAGLASHFSEQMNSFPFDQSHLQQQGQNPGTDYPFQQDSPDHMLDMDESTQTSFEGLHDHQNEQQRWHPLNAGMNESAQRQYYDSYNGGVWETDEDAMAARYTGNNEWRMGGR